MRRAQLQRLLRLCYTSVEPFNPSTLPAARCLVTVSFTDNVTKQCLIDWLRAYPHLYYLQIAGLKDVMNQQHVVAQPTSLRASITPATSVALTASRFGQKRTMFIQTQPTPNPSSLMFIPGKSVMEVRIF